jgi:hypothetical protein
MLEFSDLYKKNLNDNPKFKEEIKSEVLCSLMFLTFSKEDSYVLGTEIDNYPDLHKRDANNIGYEIVKSDLDVDLDQKKVWDVLRFVNFNYTNLLKLRDNNDEYRFLSNYDFRNCGNKISFNPKIIARDANYFILILAKNLEAKFKKLNNGNYESSPKVGLIVNMTSREKSENDLRLCLDLYNKISSNFIRKFDKFVIITTSKIVIFDGKELIYNLPDNFFNECNRAANKLLGLDW